MTRLLTALLICGLGAVPCTGATEAAARLTGEPDYTRDFDQSTSIAQDAAVSVAHSMGDLTVTAWAKHEVRVHAFIEAKGDQAEEFGDKVVIEIEEGQDSFKVMARYPEGDWEELSFAVTLDVHLPAGHALTALNSLGATTIEGMQRDVMVSAGNGSLKIQGVRGDLTLTASLGNAVVRNCEGTVDVTGHSGNVEVEDVRGDLTVRSALGQIKIVNVDGNITATGANGNIAIRGLSYANQRTGKGNRTEISSSIGSIDIALPTPPSCQLMAATTLGTIDSEFQLPKIVKGMVSEACTTKLGQGLATISLKTTNGSIRIRKEHGED